MINEVSSALGRGPDEGMCVMVRALAAALSELALRLVAAAVAVVGVVAIVAWAGPRLLEDLAAGL